MLFLTLYICIMFSQLTEDLHQVLVEKQKLLQLLRQDTTHTLMANLRQLNEKEQTLVISTVHVHVQNKTLIVLREKELAVVNVTDNIQVYGQCIIRAYCMDILPDSCLPRQYIQYMYITYSNTAFCMCIIRKLFAN